MSRSSSDEEDSSGFIGLEPDSFDGTGDLGEASTLVTRVKLLYDLNPKSFTSDHHKIIYFCHHLRGEPLDWVNPFLGRTQEQLVASGDYDFLNNTEVFFSRFLGRYGDPDPEATVHRKLDQLRQTSDARQYAIQFRIYANQLGLENAAKVQMFEAGLKGELREKIPLSLMTFDEVVAAAIRIDDRSREKSLSS